MCEADLAICAGGATTWERYCLGLPAILISVAYNQVEICEIVNGLGINWYIRKSEDIYEKDIRDAIENIKKEGFDLKGRSKKALEFVGGCGTDRVTKKILEHYINLD